MNESSASGMTPATSHPLIAPGARIGKYEVVHRIACGGMAEIYLARASGIHGFEKYVVLKRILPQYADNEDFVRMFLKEARVAASLDHANIAQVHDIGETSGGTFFTMEYLHGEDLRRVMSQVMRSRQRLPLEHALEIAMRAASGLHFAHERRGPDGRPLGIVHRDISPSNIVVTYDGGVKLVDFGIAKLAADPELSQRQALKGKLAYVSPEQLHNWPLDRRTDVFSLGVVLYEITTHRRLFKGRTDVETMKSVLEGIVPPPATVVPGYPAALERIVLRALARSPEDRYQSARDLQVDLETFVHEERLRLSPAALAGWMEQTFGAKQELWHTMPTSAGVTPPGTPGPVREPTEVTKVTSSPRPRARPPAALSGPSSVPQAPSEVAPRAPRRGWPAAVAVLASAALAALGGGFWYSRAGSRADSRASAGTSAVVLVAERGQVAVESGAVATAAPPGAQPSFAAILPPAAAQAASAPARGAAGSTADGRSSAPAAARRAGRAAASGGAARGGSFSTTFAHRESDIRRCFLDHPGARSTELSLRFDIERDGHVGSVSVQPASVASGPLGACLAAVGKSTVFPKQAAPVTFRIPLTVEAGSQNAR